jgi:hypothetical protein
VSENSSLSLPIKLDLNWTLSVTPGYRPFRGFLLRVNGGDNEVDTLDALLPSNEDDNATQKLAICNFYQEVGGLTHTSSLEKNQVSGIFRLDEPSNRVALDVTVVVENRIHSSISYYSGYRLDFLPTLQTVEYCNATNPCGLCMGDCNSNEDCTNDNECYRRTGDDASPIPGCFGAGVPGNKQHTAYFIGVNLVTYSSFQFMLPFSDYSTRR